MLLPLPLSPTNATISRRAIVKLTSSTAWSIFFDHHAPRLNCNVNPETSRRGASSPVELCRGGAAAREVAGPTTAVWSSLRTERPARDSSAPARPCQAGNGPLNCPAYQGWFFDGALAHGVSATGMEPAARRRRGEVGRDRRCR